MTVYVVSIDLTYKFYQYLMKLGQIYPNLVKFDQIRAYFLIKNAHFDLKFAQNGHFWPKMAQKWSFFGQKWRGVDWTELGQQI